MEAAFGGCSAITNRSLGSTPEAVQAFCRSGSRAISERLGGDGDSPYSPWAKKADSPLNSRKNRSSGLGSINGLGSDEPEADDYDFALQSSGNEPRMEVVSIEEVREALKKNKEQVKEQVDKALKLMQKEHKELLERQEAMVTQLIEASEAGPGASPRSLNSASRSLDSPKRGGTSPGRGEKSGRKAAGGKEGRAGSKEGAGSPRVTRKRSKEIATDDDMEEKSPEKLKKTPLTGGKGSGDQLGSDEDEEANEDADEDCCAKECGCGETFAPDATLCLGCGEKRPDVWKMVCQCGSVFKKNATSCTKCKKKRPTTEEEAGVQQEEEEEEEAEGEDDENKGGKADKESKVALKEKKRKLLALRTGAKVKESDKQTFVDEVTGEIKQGPAATKALRFVRSGCFKTFTAVLIIGNTIFMAIQIEEEAANPDQDIVPGYVAFLDLVFCALFSFELGCRIFAERMTFVTSPERWWNIFDVALVVMMVNDNIVTLAASGGEEPAEEEKEESGGDFSFIRMIRLFRVLRVVRVFKFCPQLSVILRNILESMEAVVWLFFLLGIIIFVLSLMFMTVGIGYARRSDVDLQKQASMKSWFGSLTTSHTALFQAMSGGIQWSEMGDLLMEINFIYGMLFIAFISFTVFGAVNVVTGVFVKSTLDQSRREQAASADEMGKALIACDTDLDGFVSREEFKDILKKGKLSKHLTNLDMDPLEMVGLYEAIETASDGSVQNKHLSKEFKRMTGEGWRAKVLMVHLEQKNQAKKFDQFCRFVEERFRFVGRAMGVKSGPKFYLSKPTPAAFEY